MSKLDLDIVRLQGQAYQLLEDSSISSEEIELFTETIGNIVITGLGAIATEKGLTEDEAMALLILILLKATEAVDE